MTVPVERPALGVAPSLGPHVVTFVVFEEATGRILRVGSASPASAAIQAFNKGEALFLSEDLNLMHARPESHWMQDGVPVERPEHEITADRSQIIANGVDAVTFSGVPPGARVSLNGQHRGDADGEPVHFSTARPGRHTVRFECFLARDAEFTIEARNALDR